MEILIGESLNNYFEHMRKILNKIDYDFTIEVKIKHHAKFSFNTNEFKSNFSLDSKILKNEKVEKINFSDTGFRQLCNLNETLNQYKFIIKRSSLCQEYEDKTLKFSLNYQYYDNSYTKGNIMNPIIVDDFINREFDKLNFIYYNDIPESWEPNSDENKKFTFIYFSTSDKLLDLKIINNLNDNVEMNSYNQKKIRYIYILPSGVDERKLIYNGINLLDDENSQDNEKMKENYRNDYTKPIETLIEMDKYEISQYDKEHELRNEKSESDYLFAVNFFESLKHKLSDEFEYYFLDRRHFMNEKLDLFKEGYCYLVTSDGVIENIFDANKLTFKEKLNILDESKLGMPQIENLIKIISNFKFYSISKNIFKFVDCSNKIELNHKFTFYISKDKVELVKSSVPVINYNIHCKFNKETQILISSLEMIYKVIRSNFNCVWDNKLTEIEECLNIFTHLIIEEGITGGVDQNNILITSHTILDSEKGSFKEYKFEILKIRDYFTLNKLSIISHNEKLKFLFDCTFSFWSLIPKVFIGDNYIPIENLVLLDLDANRSPSIIDNVTLLFPNKISMIIFWNPFINSQYEILLNILELFISLRETRKKKFDNLTFSIVACGTDYISLTKMILNNKLLLKFTNKNLINNFVMNQDNFFYKEMYNINNTDSGLLNIIIINRDEKIDCITNNEDIMLERLLNLCSYKNSNSNFQLLVKKEDKSNEGNYYAEDSTDVIKSDFKKIVEYYFTYLLKTNYSIGFNVVLSQKFINADCSITKEILDFKIPFVILMKSDFKKFNNFFNKLNDTNFIDKSNWKFMDNLSFIIDSSSNCEKCQNNFQVGEINPYPYKNSNNNYNLFYCKLCNKSYCRICGYNSDSFCDEKHKLLLIIFQENKISEVQIESYKIIDEEPFIIRNAIYDVDSSKCKCNLCEKTIIFNRFLLLNNFKGFKTIYSTICSFCVLNFSFSELRFRLSCYDTQFLIFMQIEK